ncbi:hypothetical protein KSW81_001145 [Nannochloris sp. 'desiccata']|nr:hypothetical protein KSW81_001145 [Chlorella desiccata (nom. nud.)]
MDCPSNSRSARFLRSRSRTLRRDPGATPRYGNPGRRDPAICQVYGRQRFEAEDCRSRDVVAGLEPEVTKFDPMAALDGGSDGLDAYRAIAAQAGAHLEVHGLIGLEIGFDQRHDVTQIFETVWIFSHRRASGLW